MLDVRWNNLDLIPKKKYLIYFVGNMSPPHKGHMDLIIPYFNKKKVKILIHLWGNEEKHKIPLKVSLDILNIYLKNVDNIKVEKYDPTFNTLYKYKKLDYLIFIRGNEGFDNRIKNDFLDSYNILIQNLRRKGVQSLIFLRNRLPNISSTEMCLSKTKISFLPDYLTEEEKHKIIKILSI